MHLSDSCKAPVWVRTIGSKYKWILFLAHLKFKQNDNICRKEHKIISIHCMMFGINCTININRAEEDWGRIHKHTVHSNRNKTKTLQIKWTFSKDCLKNLDLVLRSDVTITLTAHRATETLLKMHFHQPQPDSKCPAAAFKKRNKSGGSFEFGKKHSFHPTQIILNYNVKTTSKYPTPI